MEKQHQGRLLIPATLGRLDMGQVRSLEELPGLEHNLMEHTHFDEQPLWTRREPSGTKISPRSPRQSLNARLWGVPPASSSHPSPALLSQQQLQQHQDSRQDSCDRSSLGGKLPWEGTSFGPASSKRMNDRLDELNGHRPPNSQKPAKDRVGVAAALVLPLGGVRGIGVHFLNYYEQYEERPALRIPRNQGASANSDPLENLSFIGLSQQNSFAFPVPAPIDIDEMLDGFKGGHAAAVPVPLANAQEQFRAAEKKLSAAKEREEFEEQLCAVERKQFAARAREEQLRTIERKQTAPWSRETLEELPWPSVESNGDVSPRGSEERTQRNQTNFRANNEEAVVSLTFQSNYTAGEDPDLLDEMFKMPSLPSQYRVPNTLPGQLRNEETHQAPVKAVSYGLQHMQRLVAQYQQQVEQLPASVERRSAAKNIRQRMSDGGRLLLAGFSRGARDGVSEMPGGRLQGLVPSANARASSSGATASAGPTAGWAVSTGSAPAGGMPSTEAGSGTCKPRSLSRPSGAASRFFADNRAGRKIHPACSQGAPSRPPAEELDALLTSLMEPPALP